MLPPSSLTTTNRTSGRGSSGPTTRPGRRAAGVRSPSSAVTGAPTPRRSRRPWTRGRRCRRARGWRRPPAARARPARGRGRGPGWTSRRAARRTRPSAASTTAATSGPVRPGQPASSASRRARVAPRRRASGEPASSAAPGPAARRRRRPRSSRNVPGRASRRTGSTTTSSTSRRASSRLTGRDRVGWPTTTTRSTVGGQRPCQQQPVGAEGGRAGAGVARRLGQQRHRGRAAARRPHVRPAGRRVPDDDHGAQPGLQASGSAGHRRADVGQHDLGPGARSAAGSGTSGSASSTSRCTGPGQPAPDAGRGGEQAADLVRGALPRLGRASRSRGRGG